MQQHVPELNTTFVAPWQALEHILLSNHEKIEEWFKLQWQETPPPVYGSVDLRNAGFKLAPIDMNLFPAGFNNLNPNFLSLSVAAAKKIIHELKPNAKKILLLPENHTRNLFYWKNIKALQSILEKGGFLVRFASLDETLKQPLEIELSVDERILVEPLLRKNDQLQVENFIPDLTLLNNDLSDGIPMILQGLKHDLVPPAELGWSHRLKSDHFHYYAAVSHEFAEHLAIDPWLISPLFKHCGHIDFMQQDGLDCLIHNVEILFEEIHKKYAAYKVPYAPFIVVKADAGTYGMAVMTVRHLDELKSMNRKQRTHMAKTKGGQSVTRVIIQEGVYTFEILGKEEAVAEPVVYLWGSTVVGGFYRVHQERGIDENLNAPGMHFEPLAFPSPCSMPKAVGSSPECQKRFYVYGIVAQLSMLAAAREIKDQTKL